MIKHIISLCFFLLLLNGCGKSAEEKVIEKKIEEETGLKAEVDLTGKGMKITGKSDNEKYAVTAGDAAEIPKGFPEDVPLYNPAKVAGAMEVNDGYSISLTTKDDVAKVVSNYKEQVKSMGWSQTASMDMGGSSVLSYEKNKRVLNVAIMSVNNETRISLIVAYNDD